MNVELTVVGKRLLSSDGRKKKVIVVADNKDYFIKFNGVDESIAVFAKFRKDGKYQDFLISSDRTVQIPLWVLSEGFFEVGLYNDSTATTAFEFEVVTSILEEEGIETETPEPGVVEQLIKLVNDLQNDLPIATKESLGVVKVGDGLLIDSSGTVSVDIAEEIEADNTKPVSSAMVHTEIGNINALLETI